VRHTLKDKTKLKDESYQTALAAGRQKAERLAKTLGMEIGTIQSVKSFRRIFPRST